MKAFKVDYDKNGSAYVTINGAKHPMNRAIAETLEARLMRNPEEMMSHSGYQLASYQRKEYGAALGGLSASAAGHARVNALTPQQRTELARMAANARWNNNESK